MSESQHIDGAAIYGTMKPPALSNDAESGTNPLAAQVRKVALASEQKVTAQQMTVNLVAGGLGAGIFSLPWSTAGASILPSLAIIAGVLILNGWTIMILVEAAEIKKVFDLGGLLAHLPGFLGPSMQAFSNFLIWISGFMSLVCYFIIVADSIVPFSGGTFLAQRSVVVSFIAVLVLPLTFLSQREMSWTSSLVVTVNVYIFLLLARLYEEDRKPADLCALGVSTGLIAMVSAMMQAVIIQMCVLPMYGELEDRSPRKFLGILTTAFSFLFLIFGSFSVVAYMTFGPNVHGNILVDLPNTPAGNLARLAAAAAVLGCFPLFVMPMLSPLQNAKVFSSEGPLASIKKSVITGARLLLIMLVTVVSYFVRDLGVMNVVSGAACVGGMVSLCPALCGIYFLDRAHPMLWQMAMIALIILGTAMSVLGLSYTDNYSASLKGHCLWPL